MANYIDIETSPEGLQEDEELIEAVEAIVEIAAVSVKSQIIHELNTLQEQILSFLEYVFPILVEYQNEPNLLWQDLEHLGIFLSLFVVAYFVLSPWGSYRNKSGAGNSSTDHSKQLRRKSFGGRLRSDSNESHFQEEMENNPNNNSLNSLLARRLIMKEESDEERFTRIYPSLYAESKYYKLILPPDCLLIEKPKAIELRHQQKQQQKAAEAAKKKKVREEKVDEADDPAHRLQTYLSHFMGLVRKLFTFDYAGAAWTILLWLQGIREHRRTNSRTSLIGDNNGDTDEGHAKLNSDQSTHSNTTNDTNDFDGVDIDASDDPIDVKSPTYSVENHGEEENITTSAIAAAPPTPFATPLSDSIAPKEKEVGLLSPRVPLLESSHNKAKKQIKALSTLAEGKKESSSSITPSSLDFGDDPAVDRSKKPLNRPTPETLSLKRRLSSAEKSFISCAGNADPAPPPDWNDLAATESFVSTASSHEVPESSKVLAGRDSNTAAKKEGNDVPATPKTQANKDIEAKLRASTWYFFETAHSRESLKQMSLDVPVPDSNGYVLGDEYLPDERCTPMLVFVNSRSGPQQGHLLISQLRRLLNPIQIWDLADGPPEPVLKSFLRLTKLRILVCGGDGTVSWIISSLASLNLKRKWPPIAILPLGTGNDLARVHGWGAGYNNESLITILEQISESYVSVLDRWELTIDDGKKKTSAKAKNFFNYFSLGVDAEAALQVHYLRERRPDWFFSRFINKAWYGVLSAEESIKGNSVNVHREISLYADGVHVPLPPDSQGIIVLNIDSYAGGVPLWSYGVNESKSERPIPLRRSRSLGGIQEFDSMMRRHSADWGDSSDDFTSLLTQEETYEKVTACDMPSSCQDGLLDIVSVRGLVHLGQCKVGIGNAVRVCQCKEIKIVIRKKVAVQIDGEPWRQDKCEINIKRNTDQAIMLHRSADDGGAETEMSKLLEWAEERHLIDSHTHGILQKEFSRRIETKTRQRRVRSQEQNMIQNLKRAIGSTGAISSLGAGGNSSRYQTIQSPPRHKMRSAKSEIGLVQQHKQRQQRRNPQSNWGNSNFNNNGAINF